MSKENIVKKCLECQIILNEINPISCGHLICEYCIKYDNDSFKCPRCNQTIKKEAFKPTTKLDDKFDIILSNIEYQIKQCEFNLANGDYLIKEHYNELRRQVQLVKEEKLEEINIKVEKLMNTLNQYEIDALEYYTNGFEKKKIEEDINELKQELANSKTIKIENQLKKLKIKAQLESDKIKESILAYHAYDFEPGSHLKIGHLVPVNKNYIDFQQLIDDPKYLSRSLYDKCLEDFGYVKSKAIKIKDVLFLANGNLVIGAELFTKYYLFLFDDEFECEYGIELDVTPLFAYGNSVCLTHYVLEGNEEVPYLALLENDFYIEEKKKRKLKDEEYLMGFYKDEIYMYQQSKESETFQIWNLDFECIRKIGQHKDPEKPFYMIKSPDRLYCIEKYNEKYYVYIQKISGDLTSATVINSVSGIRISEIEFEPDDKVDIDLDGNIIVVSDEFIQYFNLYGFILKKIELFECFDFVPKQIVFDNYKKIHYYDPFELFITE